MSEKSLKIELSEIMHSNILKNKISLSVNFLRPAISIKNRFLKFL